MNYNRIIQSEVDIRASLGVTASSAITGQQLPSNAVIIVRDEANAGFVAKIHDKNEPLFRVETSADERINDQIASKIRELNLVNSRFFYQHGRDDRYTEITSQVV